MRYIKWRNYANGQDDSINCFIIWHNVLGSSDHQKSIEIDFN